MKKIFGLFFLLSFASLFAQAQNEDKTGASISAFVETNYMQLLKDIPEAALGRYGFDERKEINQLKFATVIPMYKIENHSLVLSNQFRVVAVKGNGKPSGLFTVVSKDGVFHLTDYGANGLAAVITQFLKENSSIVHPALLRDYDKETDYLFDNEASYSSQAFIRISDGVKVQLNEILN